MALFFAASNARSYLPARTDSLRIQPGSHGERLPTSCCAPSKIRMMPVGDETPGMIHSGVKVSGAIET